MQQAYTSYGCDSITTVSLVIHQTRKPSYVCLLEIGLDVLVRARLSNANEAKIRYADNNR